MLNKILEWLWSLLPDKCEVPGCCRQGVRGNEHVVEGQIICDYCHVERLANRALRE